MVLSFISSDRCSHREMSKGVSNLLKAYYGGTKPVSENQTMLAQRVFGWMKTKEHYVVCDCERDEELKSKPATHEEARLSPLRGAALPGILRALPKPPNVGHHEDCDFAKGHSGASNVVPRLQKPDQKNLAVFGAYPLGQMSQQGTLRRPRSPAHKLPSISQVLFSVIEAAGLNRIDLSGSTVTPALDAYLKSEKLSLVPGFSLKKALVTGDRDDEIGGIRRIITLKKTIADVGRWPEDLRPQGFWCGVVSGFRANAKEDRYDVTVSNWTRLQHLESRPHVFGGYTADGARQPYIAIFGYALPAKDSGRVLGIRSFMQPCFDHDCWFPVDSDYERQTLRILIDVQRSHPQYNIRISKPLFDTPIPGISKASCKADFVVNFARGESDVEVAIETMGYTDQDYEERKGRTHPLMLALYKGLIQHRFVPGRKSELRRTFRAELMAFIERGEQPAYPTLAGA
ncbi:hypothetical protein [Ensifer adhaerens]|uniref:hypothetical protein n=1 Tax=Ensifer adhaerens TaxID=106592 RepID=UPI000DC3BDAF|nr:hypothetical protein [Ensifer adhaerens]RAS09777.1 hypothetical protein DEU52_1137 [Ensifer adhaerens]